MMTNIIVGALAFLIGGFVGAIWCSNMVIKANTVYKKITGNDFVSWVFDANNEVRKHRIAKAYAAE